MPAGVQEVRVRNLHAVQVPEMDQVVFRQGRLRVGRESRLHSQRAQLRRRAVNLDRVAAGKGMKVFPDGEADR
jgi:hypothetical protein